MRTTNPTSARGSELEEFGIVIKVWPLDHESMTMRLEDLEPLMTERTKLVCVHHVSNILGGSIRSGTSPGFVHEHGARICVDGVAYAPHRAIDVQDWDVDYYVFSLYKCYGPHIAIMYGKYEHLLPSSTASTITSTARTKSPASSSRATRITSSRYSTEAVVDYLAALGEQRGRGRIGPARSWLSGLRRHRGAGTRVGGADCSRGSTRATTAT